MKVLSQIERRLLLNYRADPKVVAAVTNLRRMDLVKKPGLAETIDWARALEFLGADGLDAVVAEETLGSVIKDHDDYVLVRNSLISLSYFDQDQQFQTIELR